MMADILTVMWKEWRETVRQYGSKGSTRWSLVFTMVLFGVVFPLQSGREWVTEGGAVLLWVLGPLFLLASTIADSFAGERERQTLETLLASRLPDNAILFGKMATPLLWTWAFTQVVMLIALVPVNIIAFGQGELLLYSSQTVLAGMGLSLLVGGFIASVGTLVSLRASTVRQAQQTLGLGIFGLFLVPFALILVLRVVPEQMAENILGMVEAGSLAPFVLGFAGMLALLDLGLLALAMARFCRARLILD